MTSRTRGRTTGGLGDRSPVAVSPGERVVEADLRLPLLPAEEYEFPLLQSVEIDEAALEVLDLDAFPFETGDRFAQTASQVLPLGVEALLEGVVDVVGRVDVLPPEFAEPVRLFVDLPQPDDPTVETREEFLESRDPSVGFGRRPQPWRVRKVVLVRLGRERVHSWIPSY
jgi:hypothetical protein